MNVTRWEEENHILEEEGEEVNHTFIEIEFV